jgi:Zn-dependent protease
MSPKMASFFVALAGPMSNFAIAAILAIPIQVGAVPYIYPFTDSLDLPSILASDEERLGFFLSIGVYLNVILGVFNLIPIPPLDGFKVALGILPDDIAEEFAKLDQYGFGILIGVLFIIPLVTSYFGDPINPVWEIMAPTVRELVEFFTGAQ